MVHIHFVSMNEKLKWYFNEGVSGDKGTWASMVITIFLESLFTIATKGFLNWALRWHASSGPGSGPSSPALIRTLSPA